MSSYAQQSNGVPLKLKSDEKMPGHNNWYKVRPDIILKQRSPPSNLFLSVSDPPTADRCTSDAMCVHGSCVQNKKTGAKSCRCKEGWSGDLCDIATGKRESSINFKSSYVCRIKYTWRSAGLLTYTGFPITSIYGMLDPTKIRLKILEYQRML